MTKEIYSQSGELASASRCSRCMQHHLDLLYSQKMPSIPMTPTSIWSLQSLLGRPDSSVLCSTLPKTLPTKISPTIIITTELRLTSLRATRVSRLCLDKPQSAETLRGKFLWHRWRATSTPSTESNSTQKKSSMFSTQELQLIIQLSQWSITGISLISLSISAALTSTPSIPTRMKSLIRLRVMGP